MIMMAGWAAPYWLACLLLIGLADAKTVHVVFGNHLDIGFDNIEPYIGYDSNVLNRYFNRYLPLAVDVSDWMQRVSPQKDRYIYTTHSYVIALFLDCPASLGLACPDAATKAKVLAGIQSGAITWHAHPHNAQYEFYDSSLLEFSFDLTHDLDRRFDMKPKHTAILRDVPGLTRATIPIFVSKGIKAVSVGLNPGSAPPGVPQYTPFIWRDEASKTQLLAFWRPGGYGGIHGGVNLDPPQECIQAAGLGHVLCTAWRNDNAGPPLTVLEPIRIYQLLRGEWNSSNSSSSHKPTGADGSTVFASSFDAFVDAVLEALPGLNLTVITGEIGDTWVFGVQSDPLKTANFRAVSRARAVCLADPACPSETDAFYEFSRLLVKVPEHTWGVDIKKTLHDFVNYSNPAFHACLQQPQQQRQHQHVSNAAAAAFWAAHGKATDGLRDLPVRHVACPNYAHCLYAWDRQAAYIKWALQALPPDHQVVKAYQADVNVRQAMAAVSHDSLIAAGAVPAPSTALHAGTQFSHQQLYVHSSGGSKEAISASLLGHYAMRLWWRAFVGYANRVFLMFVRVWQGCFGLVQAVHSIIYGLSKQGNNQQQQHHCLHIGLQQLRRQEQLQPSQASVSFPGPAAAVVRQYTCGSWKFELDDVVGGLTSLARLYGPERSPGIDWAASNQQQHSNSSSGHSSSCQPGCPRQTCCKGGGAGLGSTGVLGQLRYSAYCEASYNFVWEHYSWQWPNLPWWFQLDFGKVNSSAAWDKEVHTTAHLEQVYETKSGAGALQQLALRYSFPQELVQQVGAPPIMWTIISCPKTAPLGAGSMTNAPGDAVHDGSDEALDIAVVWQNKTPTRLPESLWVSFEPSPAVIDPDSWRMHKLGSWISPREVIVNGSQSMHAVTEQGVVVNSADHSEQLQISTLDTALVSPGTPTPFPNGVFPPDLSHGMHFNLVNNIWGTNYVMWVPYSGEDVNLTFRFSISARRQ